MSILMRTLSSALVLSVAWATWWPGAGLASRPVWQAATPTPPEPRVEAFQDVNVRAGPGTEYDTVGVMIRGQSGAILGRSPNINQVWLKIVYLGGPDNTGWVFRDLVRVVGDVVELPTIIPPPTPTLAPTNTAGVPDEAQTPTPDPNAQRLPTFTGPAPVVRPTLLPVQGAREAGGVPPALIVISLFVLGAFGGLISLLRRRG